MNTDLESLETKDDVEVLNLSLSKPDAFAILVSRYELPFFHKVFAIVKNREEAQDIVQDTFVKIFIHGAKFKPQDGASFKSWGYRILLNTCFTYLKKKNREKEFVSAVEPEVLQSFGDVEDIERKYNLDHFLFIVSKLPVVVSSLLRKVMMEGKSHEEIAAEEGTSVGAVRTRLHRARAEFKKVDKNYQQLSLSKIKDVSY
ncbi:MAG TPA: RNA polymerase sigma factor [Candidatus Nanoarchaeia archaeon]|nr:RNA polymerase sigma factor [Candidatus Nanoarchaeia archaeon]